MEVSKLIERLEKILAHYELSAAGFADKIGVQRSSISHLLRGRNKPSLEFILKVVDNFPEVSLYWILYGKGSFPEVKGILAPPVVSKKPDTSNNIYPSKKKEIERIVIFYSDGSFSEYHKNV